MSDIGSRCTKSLPVPTIVTLCGSTRFIDLFAEANRRETLAGKVVLSIGVDFKHPDAAQLSAKDKERLDQLHFRKIELSDEILVLDRDGYIGESTATEIEHAALFGKRIRYWSEECQEVTE